MRAAVCLPERLENQGQLMRRYANAGIAHGERNAATVRRENAYRHLAAFRELQSVRKQVAKNLPHALRIGRELRGRAGLDRGRELEPLLPGEGSENLHERIEGSGDLYGFGIDLHLARFDLR